MGHIDHQGGVYLGSKRGSGRLAKKTAIWKLERGFKKTSQKRTHSGKENAHLRGKKKTKKVQKKQGAKPRTNTLISARRCHRGKKDRGLLSNK